MPSKTQSILLGGLVVALLSTSYLGMINLLCCAGVILGAMVSVWHYTNENELTLTSGQGAGIGVLAGIAGAIIAVGLNYLLEMLGLPSSEQISQDIQSMFIPDNMDPEQLEQMQQQQEQFNTPAMRGISMAIGVLVSAIFGAIGGAIGAAVFKKGGDEPTAIE